MEAPSVTVTRHRRPFLAPLWLVLLTALTAGVLAWSFYRGAATTVVILVRTSDKDPGTIADPPISADGEARAQRLAHVFGDVRGTGAVDAVYVSDGRRSQQTAAPLVERLHRAPVAFAEADAVATAERVLHENVGSRVVMVASSAVIPRMLRTLGSPDPAGTAPDETEPAVYMLSIPSFGRAQLLRLKL
jgi:Histidine phosphatase superfamily (branch 1)